MAGRTVSLDELVRVKARDVRAAGRMLARAFDGDELYAALFPALEQRRAVLPPLMAFRVRYGVLYGEVYAVSPALEAVAVWIWGGKSFMTPWRSLRAGGMGLYAKIGSDAARRLEDVERYATTMRRRHAPFPHWHLSPVAVDPPHQGKGLARLLLTAMFARLDAEGLPCFLETESATNVAIYEHYGFVVVEEGTVPGTEVPHWAMLREPRG